MVRPMERLYSVAERDKLLGLLRQVRLDAGLGQRELAARLGRPQSFVSKYETGERRLDVLELRLVCAALDMTLAHFVSRLESLLTLP